MRRRRGEWLRRYEGLRSVGFGIRHSGKKRQQDDSPGILFVVDRKGEPGRGGALPPEVRARLQTGKRWVMVAIPTDVIEGGAVELQAGFASCNANGKAFINGNACCPLARTPGGAAALLLGCHHVFLASLNNPGLVDHVSYNGTRIGAIAAQGQMNPGSPPTVYSNDAALAYIEDHARPAVASYWTSWSPSGIARNRIAISPAGKYSLYTDQRLISAEHIGLFVDWSVPVGGGQVIRIPEALLYDADTIDGDSGAAFIDRDTDVILGMHMARMQSPDLPTKWICVAEPSWQLTTHKGPFEMDLYLGSLD